MATEITIDGNGKFAGHKSNLTSFTVSEESTPIEGSDQSGGTGQITFGAVEDPASNGSILLLNDTLTLSDSSNGTTTGLINNVAVQNGIASITADSRLNLLNVLRQGFPVNTTLENAFRYYLGLVGITTDINVDASIASIAVIAPGFYDNVWTILKQLCVVYRCEISLVKTTIVLRPLRTRTAILTKITSIGYTVQNSDLARNVDINYYNNTQVTNALVYPYGGWNSDLQIFQVDAGQLLEFDVEPGVSLTSITQPTVVDYVDRYYTGPNSVYSVAGNDGIGIKAAQWTAQGGKLEATISDDTRSIHFKLQGPNSADYAPYSIAVSSGSSNYYSSLRIMGSGVAFKETPLRVPTGADPVKATTLVGTTVSNQFVSTVTDAQKVGYGTGGRYAAANQSLTLTATVINRAGDIGTTIYPLFSNFNSTYSGQTFSTWDSTWSGKSFQAFNDAQLAAINSTFANQAFGNIAGARVSYNDAWYRIRTASINEGGIINATAERDTTLGDFNTKYSGKLFSDFNTRFSTYKFEDFAVIPLWL